ncbi:uncharacterized protein [Clytia hemisphaerica]|uniref:uncharacterized protein n=1 Tax=Clytia hemisphaerica TaxID=252671 RepID=UPI0034D65561
MEIYHDPSYSTGHDFGKDNIYTIHPFVDDNDSGQDTNQETDQETDYDTDQETDRDADHDADHDADRDTDHQKAGDLDKDLENLILKFVDYMTGPYRGRKKRSLICVSNDVRRILRTIEAKDLKGLEEFVATDELLLKYVALCENKKLSPGTIKTYLGSMMDFLHFLGHSSKCHNLNTPNILHTENIIKDWRKKLSKKCKMFSHKKRVDDRVMSVTREQVRKYDNGPFKAKATKIIHEHRTNPNTQITRSQHTIVRSSLVVEIGLANAHRSGVAVHMKMNEFKGFIKSEEFIKIPVWDHKTIESYGPAPVHLRHNAFNNLKIYVERIRPQLNPSVDEVFVTWSGKALQLSDPSKFLHSAWKDSGIFDGQEIPRNLCMNHIRQTASTRSREENNPHTKEIAILMAHSKKTADMHYDIYEKEKASLVGAREIENIFRGETPKKDHDTKNKSPRKIWNKTEESILRNAIVEGTPVKEIPVTATTRQIRDKLRKLGPTSAIVVWSCYKNTGCL